MYLLINLLYYTLFLTIVIQLIEIKYLIKVMRKGVSI